MSAYIVEPKTVNRVLSFLLSPGRAFSMHYLQEPLSELCYCLSSRDAEQHAYQLGKKMMELNLYSVQERYPNDEDLRESDCIRTYVFRHERVSPIQAFKSLRCFLYQACEGDAGKTDLFKALWQVSERMAVVIVSSLPEWDQAEWG